MNLTVGTGTKKYTATDPISIMQVAVILATRRVSQTTLHRKQTGSIIAMPTIPGRSTMWTRMGCFAMTRRFQGATRALAFGLIAVNRTPTRIAATSDIGKLIAMAVMHTMWKDAKCVTRTV